MKAFCIGLRGAMSDRPMSRIALLVSSLPLSLTTILGLPRSALSRSSSRATQMPESEVAAISARHPRIQSVTTVRMRKRRPSVRWSDTKSSDHRSFGVIGTSIGALVPSRACGRHAGAPSASLPDRAGRACCGRAVNGDPPLPDQLDPEQVVVEGRALDLDVVDQVELPLRRSGNPRNRLSCDTGMHMV